MIGTAEIKTDLIWLSNVSILIILLYVASEFLSALIPKPS